MLHEVGQQSLAHVPQMEPVRRALLEKALTFYKEFLKERSDDPAIRRQTARVYDHVAGIHRLLGDQRQAEQAWQQSIGLLEVLVTDYPHDLECRRDLARARSRLGGLLRDDNRGNEAEKEYGAAMPVLEKLVAEHPENLDYCDELAQASQNFAALLRTLGRPQDAEEKFRDAIRLREQLARSGPDSPNAAQELARVHFSYALLLTETGRGKEAADAHRRAIDLASAVSARFPNMEDCRNIQATSLTYLGNLLRRDKQAEAAREAYDKSIALGKALVDDFPSVVGYRRQLAATYLHLGNLETSEGRTDRAVQCLESSLEQYQKLLAEAPSVPVHLQELMTCQTKLVELLESAGRRDEAQQTRKRIDESLQTLMAQQPSTLLSRQQLVEHYSGLAARLKLAKRWTEAETAANQAIETVERLLIEIPDSPECRRLLAISLRERGAVYRETKRAPGAEVDFRRAIELLNKLMSEFPDTPKYRIDLAGILYSFARLKETQAPQEAETMLRQAVRLQPDDADMQNAFGLALSRQKKLPEAAAAYREALRLKPNLSGCRVNLVRALLDQRKFADVEAELREVLKSQPNDALSLNNLAWQIVTSREPSLRKSKGAVELAERAVALKPLDMGYRNTLTIARCRAGDDAGAIESARYSLDRIGVNCDDLFVLAVAHARKKEVDQARMWLTAGSQRLERYCSDNATARAQELRQEAIAALGAAGVNVPLTPENPDDLLRRYQQVIEADPQSAWAYELRGQVYAETKQRDKAEADYHRAFELIAHHADFSLDDPQKVYDFGGGAMGRQQWGLVLAAYERVIQLRDANKRPNGNRFWTDVRPHQERGFAYHWLGEFEKAAEEYSKAIELGPDVADLWARRAKIRELLGRMDEAAADLSKAITLAPGNAYNRLRLAEVLLTQGKFVAAETPFREALKLKPDASTYNGLAEVLLRSSDPAAQHKAREAAEMAQKAVELEPNEPNYLRTLATARCRAGDNTGAIESAKRLLGLFGADWEPLLVLAIAHAREKQFEAARIWLADAERRLGGYSDDPKRANELRGEVLAALQNAGLSVPPTTQQQSPPADRLKRYQDVIDADPEAAWAYQLRAQTYAAAKERDKAEADVRRAFELIAAKRGVSLDDVEAVHALAKQFKTRRQWDLNVAANTRLILLHGEGKRPQCQNCSTELGLYQSRLGSYMQTGDFDGADSDATRAIELAPLEPSNWASRAVVRSNNADPQRALEDFAKAIELSPNRPNNWRWSDDYAILLLHLGRFKDAATEMKRLREASPDAPIVAYYQALALLAAGDAAGYRDACRAMLQKFEKTTDLAQLDWVTLTCALGPGALEDLTPAIILAEKITAAEPKESKHRLNHGALLYRAGRYREAVEVLNEVDRMMKQSGDNSLRSPAYAWFFLAMSHNRLGNRDEAARWFAQACEYAQKELAAASDPGAVGKANRWVTLRLFRDEATALLESPTAKK
jgi:tetratricopeptide (TPR) repeat protein